MKRVHDSDSGTCDEEDTSSECDAEKDGVYIVRSIDYFFLMTVRLIDMNYSDSEYRIKCISTPYEDANVVKPMPRRRFCVDLSVLVYDDGRKSKLNTLVYGKECSLLGKLERKTGTKQMLMATLAFASEHLGQNVFQFNDASQIVCDGHLISLRDYGLLVRGTTWYQRSFDAKTEKEDDAAELEKYSIRLDQTISKEQRDNLVRVLREGQLSAEKKTGYIDIVTRAVDDGSNWKEMLQVIDHDQKGCSFFSNDVVREILIMLGLLVVWEFEIEMTPETVNKFLKDTRKIY